MAPVKKVGTIQLAEGVYALVQKDFATNSGFIVGDDGVLVIEALMTTAEARHTIAEVKRVTDKPIRWLVLTHYHGDHTFATHHFLPAAIVAHTECREELIEKWDVSVGDFSRNCPELSEKFRKTRMVPPDVVFVERLTLHVEARRVELLYLGRAHTRGDVFIYLPGDRILFAGDVVDKDTVPYTADGYIGSWITVLDKLQSLEVERLVPGHGLLGDKTTIQDVHTFLAELRRQAREQFTLDKSAEEATRAIRLPQFSRWARIDDLRVPVKRLYKEFRGEL